MSQQRRSIIKHPHEYSGAPQILSPTEGFGERFDPSFLNSVSESTMQASSSSQAQPQQQHYNGAGMGGGGGESAGWSEAVGGDAQRPYDLVPQRSAPLPPGVHPATSLSSSSSSISSSAATGPMGAYRPSGKVNNSRSSPSYRGGAPSAGSGLPPSSSSASPYASLAHPSNGNMYGGGAGGGSSGSGSGMLPRGAAGPNSTAESGGRPPQPMRSHTTGPEGFSQLHTSTSSHSSPSGFTPARSHASVSGPAPSPPIGGFSSPILDSPQTGWEGENGTSAATSSPGQLTAPQLRNRDGSGSGSMGPGGRSTFKSVFGGFVNSMSGELEGQVWVGEERLSTKGVDIIHE